ncbi:aldehyde dehydrogenase [Sporosarcina sp. NCCP-2716]|uniref:aldehyde dehydrogenase n=1 Tax=Sporosarcina sp. NCCP-2716 TaxID=2943679 RepID=UPI0020420CE7|nr:aldehyde dehydrogenase [Sporosarcina sp. NCCP-2716]GKV67624.1 aldehyde dehydrogenase [Sporosarcina sp. NCCP-2716]
MTFTTNDVGQMIERQHAFYFAGATRPADFRKDMLWRLKEAIEAHESEIEEALYLDLRKNAFESYVTEIGFVLSSIGHVLKELDSWMEPVSAKTPIHLQPGKSYVLREPYGSVLIIGPFNYPFQLVMEPLVGAIAGGNCAIVKPSESSPHTAAVIRKLLESTFPPEYIRVVEGAKEETSALIHAPFDSIFFTGSVAVGKVVMKAAAERLTPVTLELGGKSPAVVDQTARLKTAAERIVWGKFSNAGQTCVAPDYAAVHRSVKPQFILEMKEAIVRFYGKDASVSNDYGRIVNGKQFDRLHGILTKEQHAVEYGGRTDRGDLYIEPTILDGVSFDSPSMEDELFGPLLPVLEYDNLGELLHRIRKLPKPLAGYMFTENKEAARYFTEQLPFGGGCINDTISHVGNIHLPFGGVGPSGMGNYHGKASFDVFTHEKAMLDRNTAIPMRAAFPPYGNKLKYIKPLIR